MMNYEPHDELTPPKRLNILSFCRCINKLRKQLAQIVCTYYYTVMLKCLT